ncbi:CBS domain-containing protein [Aliterella atlantica]|uniref:CBS domain-containing protein n=1 Tax=Aliterella atlantica CENA595 TaxID=1618023 RepID=A0A0D8ZRA2_9CYAN|nr:CBS domain-containing protein [Aliterella atlantica]KJH71245.1 CBS domain-containing protein [Aliterella atlantica CENA595]
MSRNTITIRSSATVVEAIKLMQEKGWRALVVERRHPQDAYGIITESDIVCKVVAFGKDPTKVRVYEVMTKPCIVVNPDLGVEYVARLFADCHLHVAPVIQGELLGIVSISDILSKSNFTLQPQEILLEQKLQLAIENAGISCAKKGADSIECTAAWDIVDDLQSEIAHQRAEKQPTTALVDYCKQPATSMPQRIYENWCSG